MWFSWLLLLWAPAAWAGGSVKVPQQAATLAEAVEMVGEHGSILVAPDFSPIEGVVYLDVDLSIASQSASEAASLPSLVVHSAHLDLARVEIVGSETGISELDGDVEDIAACVGFASPWDTLRVDAVVVEGTEVPAADGTLPPPPGICLVSASLEASSLELVPVGNYGLQAIASEVVVEDLVARDFVAAPAVHLAAGSDLQLTRSTFTDDLAGAVRSHGSTVAIADASFDANGSVFPTAEGDVIDGGVDVWARNSTVCIEDSTFSAWEDDYAVYYRGGAIAAWGTDLDLTGCSFGGYLADYGAVVHADGTNGGGTVRLDEVFAVGNQAAWGAVAYLTQLDQVEVLHSTFNHNFASGGGGALDVAGTSAVLVHRSLFCDDTTWGEGAAVLVESRGEDPLDFTNDVFLANRSWSGGTLAETGNSVADAGTLTVINNTFVDDLSSTAALDLHSGSVEVVNDIFHRAWIGVRLGSGVDVTRGGYNLWTDNVTDLAGHADDWFPGQGAVVDQDPDYQDHQVGRCDSVLYLDADSPARDAGDPTILDANGTRSDIGAWGGPHADIPDADLDHWGEDIDCDEDDASIYPTADEWCNEDDDDCDGEVDEADARDATSWFVDRDQDGYGDPATEVVDCEQPKDHVDRGEDCDDSDAAAYPDADEVWNDAVDQDCDGVDERSWVKGSGGCSAGPRPLLPGWALLLVGSVVGWRRRPRQATR